MTADFSTATVEIRSQWTIIFMLREDNCQPRIIFTAKINFKRNKYRYFT